MDNQVSRVYCLWKDPDLSELKLQTEEVEEVRWMNLRECRRAVEKGSIPSCIALEELEMLPLKVRTE